MGDAILITFDIDLGRPKARAVIVSAAREGEMPIIRACAFGERHTIADELYVQAVKRVPAVPKVKGNAEKPAKAEAAEKPEDAETPAEKPDQLVRSEEPAQLPEIEGDSNG